MFCEHSWKRSNGVKEKRENLWNVNDVPAKEVLHELRAKRPDLNTLNKKQHQLWEDVDFYGAVSDKDKPDSHLFLLKFFVSVVKFWAERRKGPPEIYDSFVT